MRSLFASDHRYLRRLHGRLGLAYFALPAGILLLIGVAVASGFLGLMGFSGYLVPFAFIPVPMAMAAIGLSQLSRVEGRLPRRLEYPGDEPSPAWAVWLTVGAFAALVLAVVLVSVRGFEGFAAIPIMLGFVTPLVWTARNAVLAPHLRRISKRLGLRRRPGRAATLGLVAFGTGILAFGAAAAQSVASAVLLPLVIGFSIAAVVHLMSTIGACRRRIAQVLRFRATMGKSNPGHTP